MYSHVVAIGFGTDHGYGYEGLTHNWPFNLENNCYEIFTYYFKSKIILGVLFY